MPAATQKTDTNGHDPRGRFLPGNKAGRGRPREYLGFREQAKAFMETEGIVILLEMARGRDGFAVKLLAEYAYGKPQQHMDLTTAGQPLVKVINGIDVDKACP